MVSTNLNIFIFCDFLNYTYIVHSISFPYKEVYRDVIKYFVCYQYQMYLIHVHASLNKYVVYYNR